MVLDFEEGERLSDWLKALDRPATQDEIDVFLEPLLDALETVHAGNLIHRDIAPDIIIIRPMARRYCWISGLPTRLLQRRPEPLPAVKLGYSPPVQYLTEAQGLTSMRSGRRSIAS
jgi:serine/threonine protein kinase